MLVIFNLIAIGPKTAQFTRLFTSYQAVMNCRIKYFESLILSVFRFQGLAAKHLAHATASHYSQTEQVLVIMLLNNVNLDNGTVVNAKSDMIKYAQNCK